MRIDGPHHHGINPYGQHKKNAKTVEEENNTSSVNTAIEVEKVEHDSEDQQDSGKQRGVIRNLLDGHFRGVADLRLRINFYDELNSLDQTARRESANSGIGTFLEEANRAFGEVLNDESLDDETRLSIKNLQENFNKEISELDTADKSANEIISLVRENAATIINSLSELIETTEEEETAPSLEKFSNSLNSALDTLVLQTDETSALPELSEPTGNGRAYDKFLAIYQDLQSAGEIQQSVEPESIELVV